MPRTTSSVAVDFSDTESRGGKKGRGGRKHYPPGDYAVKCVKTEIVKSSEKETPGIFMRMKITSGKFKGQEVTDTLWLSPKALWRVRSTLEAMALKVPSKKVNVDISKMVGKDFAITLDDDEYDDKIYSRVVDTFMVSELTDEDEVEDEEDDEEDTDEETEDDDEEDDDSDDDDEIEEVDLEDL